MEVFYFGCGKYEIGHYWFERKGSTYGGSVYHKVLRSIDGTLAPRIGPDRRRAPSDYDSRPEAPQGQAVLVRKAGWTIIAYWDRSGDKRGASNSAFVAEGKHSFDELLAAAREQWPWVFERQKFEVVKYEEGG